MFRIVLSTRECCDTLTLRRRDIVRITFHLISGANGAHRTWLWHSWFKRACRRWSVRVEDMLHGGAKSLWGWLRSEFWRTRK
jgi:hypothetical protein